MARSAQDQTATAEEIELVAAIRGGDEQAFRTAVERYFVAMLAVAKALAARINEEPGMKAVLTRDGDYFITLQERTLRACPGGRFCRCRPPGFLACKRRSAEM